MFFVFKKSCDDLCQEKLIKIHQINLDDVFT